MTINEYQKLAMRTNDSCNIGRLKAACQMDTPDFSQPISESDRIPTGDLICGALGLTAESGEVAELLKKAIFLGNTSFESDRLKEHLGDVCLNVALICNAMGFDLEDVMKTNKLRKQKYE